MKNNWLTRIKEALQKVMTKKEQHNSNDPYSGVLQTDKPWCKQKSRGLR